MATSYPVALDNFPNPSGSTSMGASGQLSHSAQHRNTNDAIEAIQLKLGINNSSDVNSIENILNTLKLFVQNITTANVAESLTAQYFTNDRAYNAIKAALQGGNHVNIEFSYDDSARTYSITTSAQVATKTYVDTAVSSLNNSLPSAYVQLNQIGNPDGVASLGPDGKIPDSEIPAGITRDTELTAGVADAKSYAAAQDLLVAAAAAADAADKAGAAQQAAILASEQYIYNAIDSGAQFKEKVEDLAAAIVTNGTHTGITVVFDDVNNKLNLTATYDDAEVISAIATALTAGTGLTKTVTTTPPNYLGDYNNGYSYALNDVVSIPAGSPYGIVGAYFIRTGNPSNPGYPPEPGGAPNASWTLYNFSQTITIGVDTNSIATQSYVNTAISNLVDSAPGLLDTLNEIAAAIGDDANFATTITNALATKLNITDAANTYLALSDTDERIQDVAGGMVSGNTEPTGFSATYDDNSGKLNFSITTADLPGFTEAAQDSAASLLTHGFHQNVTATYDDVNNRINLAVAAQLTQEEAQDYIAPLFVHGLNPNINATYDDVANKLILETVIPPSKAIVSPTAPASPANGEFWFDSDEYRTGNTRALKVWNSGTATWEYVASDLSLSTSNTWTSTNTFTNGIIIALDSNPTNGVHGQIYYNRITDKLKVFAGGLWQDVQVGEGGGGLSLIPTDNTLPPTTFFVGLVAPPAQSTSSGDLWIDVDDIDTPFNQFFTGGVAPDPQQYEFWVDNQEPIQELIYSADEPTTPSYPGELWIDTDEFDGAIVEFGATPPNPDNVQLWVDVNENESPSYYDQLSFPNYPTIADFPPNAPNGFIAADAATGAAYVRTQGNWLKIVTASNINDTISTNSSVFEDLKALAWMGFE